jgi:hypothetical protein
MLMCPAAYNEVASALISPRACGSMPGYNQHTYIAKLRAVTDPVFGQ